MPDGADQQGAGGGAGQSDAVSPETARRIAELEQRADGLLRRAAEAEENASYRQPDPVDFDDVVEGLARSGDGIAVEDAERRAFELRAAQSGHQIWQLRSADDRARADRNYAESLRGEAARLRREAAELRGEAFPAETDDILVETDSADTRDAIVAAGGVGGPARGAETPEAPGTNADESEPTLSESVEPTVTELEQEAERLERLAEVQEQVPTSNRGWSFVTPDYLRSLASRRRREAAELGGEVFPAETDDILVETDSADTRDAIVAAGGVGGPARSPALPGAVVAAALFAVAVLVLGGLAFATGLIGGPAEQEAAPVAAPDVTGPARPTASATRPAAEVAPTQAAPNAPPVAAEPVAPPPELAERQLWTSDAEVRADPVGDGIYSMRNVEPGHFPSYVDIVEAGATVVDAPAEVVDPAFNATTFDCTQVVDGVITACASGNPIAPGPVFVAFARMSEPIPAAGSDGLLTYALVVDADADPANNFEAQRPFLNDFYQGTDRWYELVYTAELGWYLSVDRAETASDARVAIMGDLIAFFVPAAEFTVAAPGYRVTAFASSDASYAADTSGGDVAPGPPDDDFTLAEPDVAE